jgi:hypothetical protein
MKLKRIYLFALVFGLSILSSCTGGYSFTGAEINANTKTITIEFFPNRSSLVQPNLSNVFTETLKDKFATQTNLELVNYNGDLKIEGEIINYKVTAQAYQGNETAALNRLTITVKVRFTNLYEPEKDFETNFSRYSDFDSQQSLSTVETELMDEICQELAVDIFNKAVANW